MTLKSNSLFIGMFLCAGVALSSPQAKAQPTTVHSAPQAYMESLTKQLATIEQCSLRADVRVTFFVPVHPQIPVGETIEGSFAYDASGDKWRKRSYLDSAKYPQMNTDIAYNGEVYQYAAPDEDMVTLSFDGGDNKAMGMCLPNPLIALGQSLIAEDGDTGKDITLTELRTLARAHKPQDVIWTEQQAKTTGTLAGAMYAGMPYTNKIIIPATAGTPLVMERVSEATGSLLARTSFSDWRTEPSAEGTEHHWPRNVCFESFDPATGQIAAQMVMNIHSLSFSETHETFLIDLDQTSSIWLDDSGKFLK